MRTRERSCGADCVDTSTESCQYSMSEDCEDSSVLEPSSETENDDRIRRRLVTMQDDNSRNYCDDWITMDRKILKKRRKALKLLPPCPCRLPETYSADHNSLVYNSVRWYVTRTSSSAPSLRSLNLNTKENDIGVLEDSYINSLKDHSKTPVASVLMNSKIKSGKTLLDKGRFIDERLLDLPADNKCIRSVPDDPTSDISDISANTCCYHDEKLITRGPSAGVPSIFSPDRDYEKHYKYDVLPYLECSGNWVKYHRIRPPNNENKCKENPEKEEFELLRDDMREDYS